MGMRWLVGLALVCVLAGCNSNTKEITPDATSNVKVDPKTYEDQMRKSMEYMSKNNPNMSPQMKAQMERNIQKMTGGPGDAGKTAEAPANPEK